MNRLRKARAIVARWTKPRAEWIIFSHSLHRSRKARRTESGIVTFALVGRLVVCALAVLALTSCSTIGTAISCTVEHGCVTK